MVRITEKYIPVSTPEPNGYLHLGHAKSICLNFGIANEFNGVCNLRLDDTNPVAEKIEYAEAIKDDLKWLGFDWEIDYFMHQTILTNSMNGQLN